MSYVTSSERSMISSAHKIAMSAASRYWILVRIDAAGKRRIEEIAAAKAFFLTSFPEFGIRSEVPDALIQRQLLHWKQDGSQDKCFLAERCLLCFISYQVERVCRHLENQFGAEHGFTYEELLPFVLDEDIRTTYLSQRNSSLTGYQSFPREVLDSFNPEQSSLATWTTRRVKHHKELNAFLLEHGVYLVSDWAILNDTNPKQLQRIFSQFHNLTPSEITKATQLLESYHAVYRANRLKQRQAGIKGQCQPPSTEQLQQMAQRLSTQSQQMMSCETLMAQLQALASRLREYRVYVRGGAFPSESLDATPPGTSSERTRLVDLIDERNISDEQTEFLDNYRQQFLTCLDQSVAQVTNVRVTQLQRQGMEKVQNFITAMQLFHCQGQSMTEIAKAVNLEAQFQVSRLLKLKEFRADVRQRLLVLLRDRVLEQAKVYTDVERLQSLNQQIEEALNEQITQVIQEAASQASTAKNFATSSLFSQRLCHYLDTRSNQL